MFQAAFGESCNVLCQELRSSLYEALVEARRKLQVRVVCRYRGTLWNEWRIRSSVLDASGALLMRTSHSIPGQQMCLSDGHIERSPIVSDTEVIGPHMQGSFFHWEESKLPHWHAFGGFEVHSQLTPPHFFGRNCPLERSTVNRFDVVSTARRRNQLNRQIKGMDAWT